MRTDGSAGAPAQQLCAAPVRSTLVRCSDFIKVTAATEYESAADPACRMQVGSLESTLMDLLEPQRCTWAQHTSIPSALTTNQA